MSTAKNPLYILEAAKVIVAKEQKPACDKLVDPKLTLINEEIVRIKQFVQKMKVEKSFEDIGDFKKSCNQKGLLSSDILQNIHTIGSLLELLQTHRKYLKENNPLSKSCEKPAASSFSQDFLFGNSQYTVSSLRNEFSCHFENITTRFIEAKKTLCYARLKYLLSKYEYCDSITNSIEDFLKTCDIRYSENDLPNTAHQEHMDFDKTLKEFEMMVPPPDYLDLELHRIQLGTLSHFRKVIVDEIDSYCDKINLVNNFLKSTEKTIHSENTIHIDLSFMTNIH